MLVFDWVPANAFNSRRLLIFRGPITIRRVAQECGAHRSLVAWSDDVPIAVGTLR